MSARSPRFLPASGSSAALLCALALAACGGGTEWSTNTGGGPAAPAVSLSAAPASVASGGSTLLTWSATNATDCSASGAWSGAKVVLGNQTINSIVATGQYSLTCNGPGGSTTRSVTVTVTGATGSGVAGTVDSSLVSRHQETANLVYAFAGFNNTAGTPVASTPVTQDSGACTFRYSLAALADGNYTIALSGDGGATFKRSANVTVSGAVAVQNFTPTPTQVLQVGPTRAITHPNQVTAMVQSGDVVEIDAGVYTNAESNWPTTVSNLTLRGVGGRAHMVAPTILANKKAIWVTGGKNTQVENIEFSGAAVGAADGFNGEGIRADGQDLAICASFFHDNEEGILGGAGNVLIEYTEFARNGNCNDPVSGCSHNIYIGGGARFTLRYSYSHHASIGHLVKSRAAENYILYNRIMDEADGTSSYTIDLPNGGLSYIIGNLLQQGPNTDNSTIIAYGEEGLSNPSKTLYVVNNTIVNDRPAGGTFVEITGGPSVTATLQNNLFVGNGTISTGGTVTQISNSKTSTPNFVDISTFNYRPTATTPGIDQGTAPGLGGTFDLKPAFQYLHPTNREARPAFGAIDIGAYEFVP